MTKHIATIKKWVNLFLQVLSRLFLSIKNLFMRQFNKNIYTRIVFINVMCFVICIIALIAYFDFSIERVLNNHAQQELLRKATRSNFALLQQEQWQWLVPSNEKEANISDSQQEKLRFLADVFDTRITVFDNEGNIVATSAKQEIVPGMQVEKRFISAISNSEIMVGQTLNRDTKERIFTAVVPMGESADTITNGILLEAKPAKLDGYIAQIRFYLIVAGTFVLLIIIFISIYQAVHISRPISELTTVMAELNNGNHVELEDKFSLDEFKALTEQFNKLTVKVQKIQDENQSVEKERTRLFAEISHELRTPLTAIQGFVEAIQDGIVEDKDLMDRYLAIINSQTIHINRLVDDMLQLSRLESGSINLEKLPLDLVPLTLQVIESMEALAESRNTQILLESDLQEANILGDMDRIQQIIKNLLQNGLNATENGEIKMSIKQQGDEVLITIKDNGIGISSEDLPNIWDRFYQSKVNKSNNKLKRGSGLGLVIVKQLVQLHNGTIEVESQLGKGTIFYIAFPAMKVKSVPRGRFV